jgi:hypothetical protein
MPDPPQCLRCNKAVDAAWQICPYCEAVLLGDARGSRGGIAHDLLVWAEACLDRRWVFLVVVHGGFVAIFGGITVAWLVSGLLGTLGSFVMLLVAAGLIMAVVFGLTRNSYTGRFLKVSILSVFFLVGVLAILSCVVGSVVIISVVARLLLIDAPL